MAITIELDDEQAEALAELSARLRRPNHAIVAEAVAAILPKRPERTSMSGWRNDPVLRAGFGAWKGLVPDENEPPSWEMMDPLEYQRAVRGE